MFIQNTKQFKKEFQIILVDFPGHGKSQRVEKFETDFWYYNAQVCLNLIQHLGINRLSLIGSSGGALVALNMALESPSLFDKVIADSFEGEYPLDTYIQSLEADRNRDKKKIILKLFWFFCHGWNWRKVVEQDTQMLLKFSKLKKSFFNKPISNLQTPTLLTGSREDEFCSKLEEIYKKLQDKNPLFQIHMFNKGGHPAMMSSKDEFFKTVKNFI
jgi:pimeloyl-ACP methyl ester carboxylesterase